MSYGLLAVITGIATVLLYWAAASRLKERHTQMWEGMGHPSALYRGDRDHPSLLLFDFLIRGEFRKLEDNTLQVIGVGWYACFVLTALFFLLALL